MLIYCGNSDEIKNKILKKYSDKNRFIDTGDGIFILSNDSVKNQMFEDSKTSIIYVEGDIINIDKKSLLSLLESDSKEFLKKIEGYFSLFIWDKIHKKALISNDKLGLNPLYYTLTPQNELIVSTDFEDLVRLINLPISIDKTALKQYATFNYFLGERTLIKNLFRFDPGTQIIWYNKKIIKDNYWNVVQFFSVDKILEKEFLKEFSETMLRVVSDWINGKKKVGILLSGGYDSRAILACLYNLGVRGYAYTWNNPAIKETNIARLLAEATGFELRFLPFYPEEKDIEDLILEVEQLADYSFPIFHVGRYNAIKQISDDVNIIFSGQGELIRITPVPNDYISLATLSNIYGVKDNYDVKHFFNIEYEPEIFYEFRYRHLRSVEQLTCFLLYNAYRDDYGMLRYGESKIILVAMPFLEGRIIELLLKSPFSIARLNSWKRNLPFILKTRKIYYDLVKKLAPHLLDIPLDRGYLQKFDNCLLNSIFFGVGSLKNIINSQLKKKEIPPWWKFVYNLLLQSKTLNREFYNKQKIEESLKKFPSWTPAESYELEKVARFELFYRHFFESV